jgi:hypothetical protein
MTATSPEASRQAVVEAALVLLERMGLTPADLAAVPQARKSVPTFAEYVPVVSTAVSAGTRRAYGSYWNRILEHWGSRRLDEPTPSEIRRLMAYVKTHVVARRNGRGGRSAEEHLVAAVNALGPVPDHPLNRLDWQRGASSIGAYRELSGHSDPADPIGSEPAAATPDIRAAWHEALAALGPADGPDVRGLPDGRLLHLRDTYPVETAWAPQYVGDELRQVRAAARDARLAAIRAAAEADAADRHGQHGQASRHRDLAASYQAMHHAYRERETVFAAVMADRADWDTATRHQRHLAVAADAELRRRHPGQHYLPLRSAEPDPATESQRAELTLAPGEQIREISQWIKDLAAQRRAFADRLAERQSLTIPAADPDYEDLGPAFPAWTASPRDAILQPPKPEIRPSTLILERVADRDADWEAAD